MKKKYIYLIIFIVGVFSIMFAYAVPFTKYQVYKGVDEYFNRLQNREIESLALITTTDQLKRDKQLLADISKQTGTGIEFRNRKVQINDNSMSKATVVISSVVKYNINDTVKAQPVEYQLQLVKSKNQRGEKVWIVYQRAEIK